MADDLNAKIQSLLSDPNAMNMISSLLGKNEDKTEEITTPDNDFSEKITSALSNLNTGSDRRINLLNALKPYMRQSRLSSIDKAIKILKLTQMTSLFKDL
ncbi:MAG: hypothetical protein II998_10985 [Clostridia bacterium]|nr:hypothetical protein [Clostridia bacterium]